jgi:hypothetical protein
MRWLPSTESTARTGCSTRFVEKLFSADAIVSMRSSIVRTDLTSDSVRMRKRIGHKSVQLTATASRIVLDVIVTMASTSGA